MKFPDTGLSSSEVLDSMQDFAGKSGLTKTEMEKHLTGSYPLTGLDELRELVIRTFSEFVDSNTMFFSEHGVQQMEREVISMIGDLWNSSSNSPGLFLSGGSESNFVALYVAKRRSAFKTGSAIMPLTAHPSVL